ncbi:hypothetical protein B0H17DRAFT_1139909 [Mycena rosella]|uniref:Uncharacterized protein n=1 Tax=Mycena rosella TaxID=1033263 RepID=A0AAD7GAR4_MYCRO|nr:hypothetical protein B0H17DRAFT_1139909 [Mycena rosella]
MILVLSSPDPFASPNPASIAHALFSNPMQFMLMQQQHLQRSGISPPYATQSFQQSPGMHHTLFKAYHSRYQLDRLVDPFRIFLCPNATVAVSREVYNNYNNCPNLTASTSGVQATTSQNKSPSPLTVEDATISQTPTRGAKRAGR